MLKTALEFAQGTADANKKIVLGIFSPQELLRAYRIAKSEHNTGDVVLWTSVRDPSEIFAGSRKAYCEFLGRAYPRVASQFALWSKTAQQIATLPHESEAFWLVINLPNQELPSMSVLYAISYEQAPADGELKEELAS